jgi:hypothetical protein
LIVVAVAREEAASAIARAARQIANTSKRNVDFMILKNLSGS